jgi:hypothetical protein
VGGIMAETVGIITEFQKLDSLLKEFDFQLIGFDPGIMVSKVENTNDYFSLDGNAWYHIKPLLEELRDFRRS